MKSLQLKSSALLCAILLSIIAQGQVVYIDFDNGTSGNAIDSFYINDCVVFQNTQFAAVLLPPFDGIDDQIGASLPNVILSISNSGAVVEANPIVAVFTQDVDSVAIRALDVGGSDAQMKAYDAVTGGNLVDSDIFIGSGAGTGNFGELIVTAPNIRRVEIFRPSPIPGDGEWFDNMAFNKVPLQVVPVSSRFSMLLISMLILCVGVYAAFSFRK